jgi:hypothetical protein
MRQFSSLNAINNMPYAQREGRPLLALVGSPRLAGARSSPASLRSPPSPAVRERGYDALSQLLSRTAGEGGPSPKGLVGEGSDPMQGPGG